jgi:hypothetical protein
MRTFALWAAAFFLTGSLTLAGGEDGAPSIGSRSQTVAPQHAEFFEARIRPILAEHCFQCHGPKKQEAGLRLDSKAGLLKGNDAGPVVLPGRPEESPLIEAIRHDAPVKMPPKAKLPPQAIADLTTWVKLGVPWPESTRDSPTGTPAALAAIAAAAKRHWAFQPVKDAPPPAVKGTDWPRNSVDRFILARLEAAGVSPSTRADKRTLIRRATFDLIGLPPSPEEVAAFEADTSASAYDRLIERLLSSPHYGERWGRYWLDVARYADTKGYVFFQDADFHWAYTYRDYVTSAFNHDLPYDRFLIEQIAADRLSPEQGKAPLSALGFLTLGSRFMGNVHDIIDDRIDTICRGLMSLTVACARCHDHKYDPIPTQDYYSLYGVLASAQEPLIPPEASLPPRTAVYAQYVLELEARRRKLAEFVAVKRRELVESSKLRVAEYLLAAQRALEQPSTEDFMLIADGTDLNPAMLVRWQVYLSRTRREHNPVFAPWHALAGLPERGFSARAAPLVARLAAAAAMSPRPGTQPGGLAPVNPVVAHALAERVPRSSAELAQIYAKLLGNAEHLWQDAVRRATLEGRAPEPLPVPALESLRLEFHGPDSPLNVLVFPYGDLALLPDRPSQAKLKELRDALEKWLTAGPGAPPRAICVQDVPTPVEPRVFVRGTPNNLGEPVPRRFLAALAGADRKPFSDGSGRLELARAIASRDNPLTARVLVNRAWMHHFGTPLVTTPGDFGLRSEPPIQVQVLDHLAARFMDAGWSIKALHRLIMFSNTYQQRSDDRPAARGQDPENTLYWRMNRRRLDFEATRDALLAVSGRLDSKVGGAPMPSLTGTTTFRRSLYGFIDRLNLPGLYRTFDFPDPNATSPRRDQTTVAPQALFLMNHPFVIAAARAIVARPVVTAEAEADAKIVRLYRLIYGRAPGNEELVFAREFLSGPPTKPARWHALAQALLMANEFVFVD